MNNLTLWDKVMFTTIWTLIVLFILSGSLGGLVYLAREVFMK